MLIKRHTHSYKLRIQVLDALRSASQRSVSRRFGISRWTLRYWLREEGAIREHRGPRRQRSRTAGRLETLPFADHLLTFMKDTRRDEKLLTTTLMVTFIKINYAEWLRSYIATKQSVDCAYDSLMRLVRRFAVRHGFSQRVITRSVENQVELLQTRDEFSATFHSQYSAHSPSDIINIDETGVYYDMPPSRTLAIRGGSSKVANLPSHSARMTAVLAIRGDGRKLPILFIVKGSENGSLRKNELPLYPKGHFYTTQTNAWMDSRVWAEYLREVITPEIEGPSVILVDNLDAHVSSEAVSIVASEMHSSLQPLPPNSTSVCQPLDVGVMGPLKKKLRSEWLIEEHLAGATAKQKRIAMIKRTIKVWNSLTEDTIKSSFSKALPGAGF